MRLISMLLILVGVGLGMECTAQTKRITLSGITHDQETHKPLAYVNVVLKSGNDSLFITGGLSNEDGQFSLSSLSPGNYYLEFTLIGYHSIKKPYFIGSLSDYLDFGTIELSANVRSLKEVEISAKQDEVSSTLDKKSYSVSENISQAGGSVLQTMQNLPGVTVQDGKVQLRGNDKVTVLIDGKQTALTGFGSQTGLDNLPSSSIEKIEIIQNPSSKYDANGNAGIINIILKKSNQDGFSGKIGFSTGAGAFWVKKENLPTIRPQYQFTPKYNPSVSLNYRKKKINAFLQVDNLYTHTLNKNEFVTRTYDDGTIINQQLKRNRNTNFFNSKIGLDWNINAHNSFSISGLFGTEKILDHGDEPFFNTNTSERIRLWQFLEDELKTTVMATAAYQHKFKQAGHLINVGLNYTFHREDEKYYFDNILPSYAGKDAFKLLSDEKVADFNFDYIKPLKYGRIETGVKLRRRTIPTNMQFFPGLNSPLDTNAGGWATYKETIPALYGNYVFENKRWEAELGIRYEYVVLHYEVNPEHNTYKSNGYNYSQPFPNLRLGYKINDRNKLSVFYNRRVDRPNEVDIRIFPKYDDAEIIKVGNPALKPQFTQSLEMAYKSSWDKGYVYISAYQRNVQGTITRISSIAPNSSFIYAIFQNAGKSYTSGLELILSHELTKWYSFNLSMNAYHNQIDAFTVENKYPVTSLFTAAKQEIISGNVKLNSTFHFAKKLDAQLSAVYLAPDIIPQGKIAQRFSLDLGIKKTIQKGRGVLFLNATDVLNTLIIKKQIQGQGFRYTSSDYYETQVVRLGYTYSL